MQNHEPIDRNTEELARAIAHLIQSEHTTAAADPPRRVRPGNPGGPAAEGPESIDILQLLYALRDKIVFIIICAVLGGLLAYGYTAKFVTPMYQASIKMIVNARNDDPYNNTAKTVSDITSAQSLVATYATVIKSSRVMNQVVDQLNLNMNWRTLNSKVQVRPVESTPVINIIVTADDPEFCRQVVTTISQIAPDLIVEAVEAGSCKVIDDADCTGFPISPDIRSNTMKGAMLGAALCCGVVALFFLLNDSIESEEQLTELSPMPVLSTIPNADTVGKHKGYGYGYGRRNQKRAKKEDNK